MMPTIADDLGDECQVSARAVALCGDERIEHVRLQVVRNARAVVLADLDHERQVDAGVGVLGIEEADAGTEPPTPRIRPASAAGAGAPYGRDVPRPRAPASVRQGLEIVRFCTPEQALEQLELLTLAHAEEVLKRLGLHHMWSNTSLPT